METNTSSLKKIVRVKRKKISKSNIFDFETVFLNLNDIFDQNRHFVIPNYQRGYAWEDRQVNDLWNDINVLLDSDNNEKHYMGILALTKTSDDDRSKLWIDDDDKCYDIIDGQQRLTTLIIILSELRKYIPEIESKYITTTGNAYKLDYIIQNNNRDFLVNNIYNKQESNPKTLYQTNLNRAKLNIREKLEKVDDKRKLYECITNNLEFNLYFNASQFDARKTFETMNYRGKRLSYLELLKNKLIYLSTKYKSKENQLISKITDAWSNIYTNLGCNPDKPLRDDEFLKAHWVIYGKANTELLKTKGDAYAEDILNIYFAERIFDPKTNTTKPNPNLSDTQILNYVKSLEECSNTWKYVKYPNLSANELGLGAKEKIWLDKLSRIRNFEFANAFILSLLHCRQYSSDDARNSVWKTLENFIFINYCFFRPKSNDLSFVNPYSVRIFKSTDPNNTESILEEFKVILTNNHPTIAITTTLPNVLKHIKEEIKINYFSNFQKGLNYFLFENNRELQQTKYAVPLDWNNFNTKSIEHILPQSYKKIESWRLVMDKYKDNLVLYDKYKNHTIINNIGNLVGITTTGKNSSLSNNSYYVKSQLKLSADRPSYKDGTYSERLIADNPTWTVKSIYNRAIDLLIYMFDTWFIDYLPDDEKNKYLGKINKENDQDQQVLEDNLSSPSQSNKEESIKDPKAEYLKDYVGFTVVENDQEQQELEYDLINRCYPEELRLWEAKQNQNSRTNQSSNTIKISDIVKGEFKALITHPYFPDELITKLQDLNYCKSTFHFQYEVLKLVDTNQSLEEQFKCERENNGMSRYYKRKAYQPIIKGRHYLLCNQFREDQMSILKQWIEDNKITD